MGVSTGQREDQWQPTGTAALEDELVPLPQPVDRHGQPPEAIIMIGIRTREVEDEIGARGVEHGIEVRPQGGEVGRVIAVIGQTDIARTRLLVKGKVGLPVHLRQ